MSARHTTLFVGFDACDPAIALDFAERGRMPALAQLLRRGVRCPVRKPYGLFVGALWMTFATGLSPDRHGFHCWDEIEIASYRRRLTTPKQVAAPTFWQAISKAGREVAVLNVPHSRARGLGQGLMVAEWGCHDRHFGFHTWPPTEAARIEGDFGLHPIFGMDAYAAREFAPDDYAYRASRRRRPDEERRLLDSLLRGVDAKRCLSTSLLAERRWDLFLTVLGEGHAVGHQQWHLHDPGHPRHDPAVAAALGGDPLQQVYERLDGALGDLLSLVDDQTIVFTLLSHGMAAHYDGTHLLEEVLRRIDSADRVERSGWRAGGMLDWVAGRLAGTARRDSDMLSLAEARHRAAGRMLKPCREFATPRQRARQRFFLEPNNYVYGGVRLNLIGREPNGLVPKGAVEEISARLAEDLRQLVNLDSGGPVVRGIERADRLYRRSESDTMPDLFIDWDRTAPIETVWSPKTGLVHAPYVNWRTGNHRPDGLLLVAGPGIPAAGAAPEIMLEDLAPSLAARLDVALENVDGRRVDWIAARG